MSGACILVAEKLPFSIRVLLESAVRSCDDFHVLQSDIENILDWKVKQDDVEIPFKPARVLLQDFTLVFYVYLAHFFNAGRGRLSSLCLC